MTQSPPEAPPKRRPRPQQVEVKPVVLKVSGAADYLNVSAKTIRRMVEAGALKHTRIHKSIRIPVAELDRYIAANLSTHLARVDGRGGQRTPDMPSEEQRSTGVNHWAKLARKGKRPTQPDSFASRTQGDPDEDLGPAI
jgi:excisionase family DNA binding protein